MMKIAFKQNGICIGYGSEDSKEMIDHIADSSLIVLNFPEPPKGPFADYFLEYNNTIVYLPQSAYTSWWVLPTLDLNYFIAVPITAAISSTDPPDGRKWFKVENMVYTDISNNLNQFDLET